VSIESERPVRGLYVSSHRPVYLYQRVETIPTKLDVTEQLLNQYFNEIRSRFALNQRTRSPSHRIKEALISLATFGYGNQVVKRNEHAIEVFEGFQEILRVVLPQSLGFTSIVIRMPEVVLEATSGDVSLDAVSGGIAALVDVSWQIYMYRQLHERFTVVIDEPENHLHPELQRIILPSLIRAFPGVRFIAATHNPFIVSSVPESHVYVLDYGEDRKVSSELLDLVNRAGSSNDILRQVLGVPVTIPAWVEEQIDGIVERYRGQLITREALKSLRDEMKGLGFDHVFPETLDRVIEGDKS
jgi:hypothetical protein